MYDTKSSRDNGIAVTIFKIYSGTAYTKLKPTSENRWCVRSVFVDGYQVNKILTIEKYNVERPHGYKSNQ